MKRSNSFIGKMVERINMKNRKEREGSHDGERELPLSWAMSRR
jgi:hypothetical protein